MRTKLAATVAALAIALVAAPAHAVNVTVHFSLSAGHYIPPVACDLTVVQGATGIDVLDEAVDQECIDDYEVLPSGWLRCIEKVVELCSAPGEDIFDLGTLFWAFYEDHGTFPEHAVAGFSAGNSTHTGQLGLPVPHKKMVLSWESWLKCFGFPVFCGNIEP